jgi:PKD repeat protein
MSKLKIIFFVLFSIPFILFSQDLKKCKTTEMNKLLELKYPQIKERRNQLEKFTQNFISNKNRSEEIYIIPVVFHVVHNNGTENISKAQIIDAVRILNEDFRKLNADTSSIIPEFKGIAADSKIEFRLARIAPDGSCTEGITRTQSILTNQANDNAKFVAPAWPRDKYFNIWVVKSVEGAAGYAYYPSDWTDAEIDGVIIDNSYIGSIGTGSKGTSRALTHEIGHSFNLMHPWGDSNEPGLPENCNDDDLVDDTPNTIGHTTCVLTAVTCGSLDNVQNYMEYAYCDRMFTFGQKDRMRATLNSDIADRIYLWQQSNLIETGTNDEYVANNCIPKADFGFNFSSICSYNSVNFYDLSYNADVDSTWNWNWTFEGGNPNTSTLQNPIVSYSNVGTYNVRLSVSNNSGTNSILKTDMITVFEKLDGEFAPYTESFESSSFPINQSNSNKNWEIQKGDEYEFWARTSIASYSGNYSIKLNNNNIYIGTKNSFISPIIVLDTSAINTLSFNVAYARKDVSSTDYLRVYLSPNCGKTWHLRYGRSGGSLDTNGGGYVTDDFIPTSTEWRKDNVTLGIYGDSTSIRLKFECTSGGGNNLYVDDIVLNSVTQSEYLEENPNYISIFPNPINEETKIEFALLKPSKVYFLIFDISGKIIYKYQNDKTLSDFSVNINELIQLQKGIYFIQFDIDGNKLIEKILKLE